MKLTIREVTTYETRTPFGPKRVIVHKKVSEIEEDVPAEVIKQMSGVPDFGDQDVIVEGIGIVLANSNGQVFPQQYHFRFPSNVTNYTDAFKVFDESLEADAKKRQEEENRNQIQTASETDLNAINAIAARKGIQI